METPKYTVVIEVFENWETLEKPVAQEAEKPRAEMTTDPFADLIAATKPIEISYSPRYQNSATKAFMDFNKKDERWLKLLIQDLQMIGHKSQTDNAIMKRTAVVRNRFKEAQTWQDIIDGIVQDKIKGGRDFSEGQMKQLIRLLELLSAGKTLANCQTIKFVNDISEKKI